MTTDSPKRKLSTWLFSPAVYIAGAEALIVGIVVILATSWVGHLSRTHFDGVLDAHTGMDAPSWLFLAEGLIAWLSATVVLGITGKIASRTSFRFVDLAGTQALARWPVLLTAVVALLPGYVRFTKSIIKLAEKNAMPAAESFLTLDAAVFFLVLALMLVALCWTVMLMYRSYAHVCNIRGGRAGWSFAIAVVVAEILSKVAIICLSCHVLPDDSWRARKCELPQSAAVTNYQHEQLYTFDTDQGLEKVNGDKGLSVGVTNGEFRIHGQTTDLDWGPDAVQAPVTDGGGAIDISGRFRIAERSGSGLVFIEASTENAGPIIYMYQWVRHGGLNVYQIQMRWLHIPATLVRGLRSLRAMGNEGKAFNTMRIHIREDRCNADFFVNDTYQDTIAFTQHVGKVMMAKMELQTPCKGKQYDIRFDDLRIRWNDSPEDIQAVQKEAESTGKQ